MATIEELPHRRRSAFEAARGLVADWRATGRHTTTAGITSALKTAGVLDLPQLGFTSNREFWEHAGRSGLLHLAQQPNGHWLLLLPDESLDDIAPPIPRPAPEETPTDAEVRLKGDVWTCFVDWNPAYRRFWDREHSRAFMIPTAPGWLEGTADTDRFAEIEPAGQRVQIDWMRTFANEQPGADREGLVAALAPDAPRGAFRRELRTRGLAQRWRATLRDHIVAVAVAWAEDRGIEVGSIMENRTRDLTTPSVTSRIADVQNTESSRESGHPHTTPALDRGKDRIDVLRQRLHQVIDTMTWDELARIEVRAEYLVRP